MIVITVTIVILAQAKGGPSKGGFLNTIFWFIDGSIFELCNVINGVFIKIMYFSVK